LRPRLLAILERISCKSRGCGRDIRKEDRNKRDGDEDEDSNWRVAGRCCNDVGMRKKKEVRKKERNEKDGCDVWRGSLSTWGVHKMVTKKVTAAWSWRVA
jgi:hypothetical protein